MNKEEKLKMARDAGFKRMEMPWYQMYAYDEQVIALIDLVLERAALECQESELYRGSVFASRIRALKSSIDA